MPSGKPITPEEGFRRQLNGFNRDDVLAYINALVNEAQQKQLTGEEQVKQLQAQIERYKKEQANARACVEKLQNDLLQQTNRAEQAEHNLADSEKKLADCQEQLTVSESRANGYQGRYQQSQRTMLEWQNKCHELEQQLEDARKAAAAAAIAGAADRTGPADDTMPVPEQRPLSESAPQPEAEPLPQPEAGSEAEQAAPAPPPEPPAPPRPEHPAADLATVQARKILADARITAQNAIRRMQQEAEEQKARMAENARDLAAGVQVLRDRLTRVDEKLSAASLELENATAAIYEALDHTDADLQSLGVKLDEFANGTPETDAPAPPPPSQPETPPVPAAPEGEPPRPSAQARRVRPVVKAKPPKPAARPATRRLRSVQDADRRAVAQSLLDAMNRVDGSDTDL